MVARLNWETRNRNIKNYRSSKDSKEKDLFVSSRPFTGKYVGVCWICGIRYEAGTSLKYVMAENDVRHVVHAFCIDWLDSGE
jgi:hypothetical protein